MTAPGVSVIALTRDRPKEFRALLDAMALQRHRDFDLIVIGAAPRVEDHGATPEQAERITYAACADSNVSLSRNLGLSLAKGEIVVFIDDDAAPEPDWIEKLVRPFRKPDVGAVGGFVRGRNGVDFQWRGAVVDRYGGHRALTAEDLASQDLGAQDGERFVSTVGVNTAFRRSALEQVGGFDEQLVYFLDESDACIRLLKAGWRTVFAPSAEVHHAYAASALRHANRAPRDLYEIAASRSYFSRVYGHANWYERQMDRFLSDQKRRLRKFVQLGRLSRRRADELIEQVENGVADGERRFRDGRRLGAPRSPPPAKLSTKLFRTQEPARRPRVALVVTDLARKKVYRAAKRLADAGHEVSVIDFELKAKRLRVWFEDGFWRHVGGVVGRDRFDAPIPPPRRCLRVAREIERVSPRRDFDVVIRPSARKFRLGDLAVRPLGGDLSGFVAEPLRLGGAEDALAALGEPVGDGVISV